MSISFFDPKLDNSVILCWSVRVVRSFGWEFFNVEVGEMKRQKKKISSTSEFAMFYVLRIYSNGFSSTQPRSPCLKSPRAAGIAGIN